MSSIAISKLGFSVFCVLLCLFTYVSVKSASSNGVDAAQKSTDQHIFQPRNNGANDTLTVEIGASEKLVRIRRWGDSSRGSSSSGGFRDRLRSTYNRAKTKAKSGYNRLKNRVSGRSSSRSRGSSRGSGSSSSWGRRSSSGGRSGVRSGGNSWGTSGRRSTGSRGGSTSRTSNRGFKDRIRSGYDKLKKKFGGGRKSTGGSSSKSSSSWRSRGRALKNKIKNGASKVKDRLLRRKKPKPKPKPGSGYGKPKQPSMSIRDRIRSGINKVKNKIRGGPKPKPVSGYGTPKPRGSMIDKIKSGMRKVKEKVTRRKKPHPIPSGGRQTGHISKPKPSIKDRIKSGLRKVKEKIGGRKKPKPISPGLPIPSSGYTDRKDIAYPRPSGPRKPSLFSKIKSKAVPFLKKPSTQKMLKKGAKWILRKYKSRKAKKNLRGRYSAQGIYGYGGPNIPRYGYGGYHHGQGYGDGGYVDDRRVPEVVSHEWSSGTSKGAELQHGQSLRPGESLLSPNGKFEALLDTSGDLILYDKQNEAAYWHTDTSGPIDSGYRLSMNYDNEAAVSIGRKTLWGSGTKYQGLGFADMVLQDDGMLVIRDQRGDAIWNSSSTKEELEPRLALYNNQTMYEENDALVSPSGQFYAIIEEGTGRLVIYDSANDKVSWMSTNTASDKPPFRLAMQEDNNLVMYGSTNTVMWSSGTNGKGVGLAMAQLNDTGRVVVMDSENTVLWSSGA